MVVRIGVALSRDEPMVLRQHVAPAKSLPIESGIGPDATVQRAVLSPEAALTLALSAAHRGPAPKPVRWCLVSDDPRGNLHVRKVVEAHTRADAVRLFGAYPTDWFVTSALALSTMGAMPVPTRCACGDIIGEGERSCERCRATSRRRSA